MMGLNALLALKNIRIDRTLCQELDPFLLCGFFRKYLDEFPAYDLPLCLRISHAFQKAKETVRRVYVYQVRIHLIPENTDHLFRLTLAKKSVIHMDTNQLLSDRSDQQSRYDGRIHAAGKGQQDFLIPNLFLNRFHLLIDKSLSKLGCRNTFHRLRSLIVCHSNVSSLNEIFLLLIIPQKAAGLF